MHWTPLRTAPALSPCPSLCCEQTLAAVEQAQHPLDRWKDGGRGAGAMQSRGHSCHSVHGSRPPTQSHRAARGRAASLPSWDPGGQPAGRAGPRRSGGEGLWQRLQSRWPVGTWWALLGRPGPCVPPCRPAPPAPAPAPETFHILFRWLCGRRGPGRASSPEPVSRDLLPCGACRFLFSLSLSFLTSPPSPAAWREKAGTEVFKPQFLPPPPSLELSAWNSPQ